MKLRTMPIFFAFFVMGFVDAVGTLVGFAKEEYQLSGFMAGLLPFFGFIAFALVSVPGGVLMDKKGKKQVEVTLRPEDKDMPISGWIDPNNFNPGYLMRAMHLLPQRGDKPEWQHTQDYWTEKDALPNASLEDGCLRYS